MIAENFRVVLAKYIGIAADVFINRVFKGNKVTDCDSAPYRTSISTQFHHSSSQTYSVPGLQQSQNIASQFHGFRKPKISFFDSVTALVKILLQIANFGHTDSRAESPWNFKRV